MPGVGQPVTEIIAERPQPERRQLTVLFCDLVGSTMLANRLDPEEMRDLIHSYQVACSAAIRGFDGTITRYVGDGILALFGYPRAHEDDAERAVRSALDIIRAVSTIVVHDGADRPEPLAVRIGIATGLVVVGDLIGEGAVEAQAVFGETPNLGARLQALAEPNSVVIAMSTRALIGERFDCADLGVHELKGFSGPVRAWRVLAPRRVGSRFEAAQPVGVSPLVGRKEHLARLLCLWQEAKQHRGKVVLLVGEAGIGKSRVVEALREQIQDTPHVLLRYQCSPHYINTALYPVIQQIENAAGIGHEDTPSLKLDKLAAWVQAGRDFADAVSLLGALLSIPTGARYPAQAMSPQLQKDRTFGLLLDLMQRLASERPVLMVGEDLHWADPTTLEFLGRLIALVGSMNVLIVLTFRPDFTAPWRDMPHVERRELERLAPEDALGLAMQVAGVQQLPKSLIEQVVARTDGVPLFVEELTRALLGAGLVDTQTPLPSYSIPFTLQDSLMARLDQLGRAKLVAQVSGAIGREFSYEMLEAVVPLSRERLREDLRVLEQTGLVRARQGSGSPVYTFKHALVQEAAYQSMLIARRRDLHLRIAEVLENRFPQTARDTPELVAHHWTEAGNAERAVAGWLVAGQRASLRSEYREAIGHLRRGLGLTSRIADAELRRERELALLLALGPALITTEGGGTTEVGASYARALELCEQTPAAATHFAAHWGWWRSSMDHRMGRERADKLFALSRNLGKPEFLLQAHHCQWATLYMLGAHSECWRHVEAGLGLYDRQRDHAHAALYGGHDARVCALGEGALARWMLGHPQEALALSQSALAWSNDLSHVGSRVHAMDYALVLHRFRRNAAAVAQQAAQLFAFASEQKLRVFRAKGAFFHGWARAMLEDVPGGLNEMLDGIASEQAADTPHDFTLYHEMLAEIYARAGRLDEALMAVSDAFAVAEQHGIVYWNAELHRRQGELLLASGDRNAAETCFQQALDCARAQEARSLELRAAASLARLHIAAGERATARVVLRPIFECFSEGLDMPDLAEARQLLEALA